MKVMTVLGTRPEIIRLSLVIGPPIPRLLALTAAASVRKHFHSLGSNGLTAALACP